MKTVLTAAIFISFLPLTIAQWSTDPKTNNAVCFNAGDQFINGMTTDGSGGAIISWWDNRVTSSHQLPFAQRISSNGTGLWEVNGIPLVHTSAKELRGFKIKSDANGGAFYTFMKREEDPSHNFNLYGGHINSNGDTTTFLISGAPNISEETSDICLSGDGAIIAFEVFRPALNDYDIYVQRINKNGELFWNKDSLVTGIRLISENSFQRYPRIERDGSGGAFIVWEDLRNVSTTLWDIYIQRIDSNGIAQWAGGGVPVVHQMNNQRFPRIAKTSYGVAVCWDDERLGYTRLYARGINFDGTIAWGDSEGKMIGDSVLVTESTDMISFGDNGNPNVAISWSQNTFQTSFIDIYAQVLDSGGNPLWQNKGLLVCNSDNMQWKSKVAVVNENGNNKIVVVWQDERNSSTTNNDIYAQKISSNGSFDWTPNGIEVTNANNYQSDPLIIAGESGYSIAAWSDGRSSSFGSDIYAQRLSPGGVVSVKDKSNKIPDGFTLFNNYPNPFNPSTKIEYKTEKEGIVTLKVYDLLGNEIVTLINEQKSVGKYEVNFDASSLTSGVYFYKLQSGEFTDTKKMMLIK